MVSVAVRLGSGTRGSRWISGEGQGLRWECGIDRVSYLLSLFTIGYWALGFDLIIPYSLLNWAHNISAPPKIGPKTYQPLLFYTYIREIFRGGAPHAWEP